MKNTEKIIAQLDSKKLRLKKALDAGYPIDPALVEAHERRMSNAEIFLEELDALSYLLNLDMNIQLVYLSTLEKQAEKADFASIDFDGQFCKLFLIQNYPYDSMWLLYVAPVESI